MLIGSGLGWSPSPLPIGLAVLLLALFANGFVRLRRRAPRHARWWRAFAFTLAVMLGLAATISPLHEIGEDDLLSAHMLEHVTIGDLAPALALVALRGPMLAFVVPAVAIAAVTRRPSLRAALRMLTRPWVALMVWSASIAVWHVPSVYDAAAGSPTLHVLEHTSFVVAGTVLWFVLIDPARRGAVTTGGRLALALAAFTVGQFLATTLVLAQHPLFPTYADASGRLGLSPLSDQATAGLVMMGEQLLTLGVLAAFAVRRHLEETLAQPTTDPLVRPAPLR